MATPQEATNNPERKKHIAEGTWDFSVDEKNEKDTSTSSSLWHASTQNGAGKLLKSGDRIVPSAAKFLRSLMPGPYQVMIAKPITQGPR